MHRKKYTKSQNENAKNSRRTREQIAEWDHLLEQRFQRVDLMQTFPKRHFPVRYSSWIHCRWWGRTCIVVYSSRFCGKISCNRAGYGISSSYYPVNLIKTRFMCIYFGKSKQLTLLCEIFQRVRRKKSEHPKSEESQRKMIKVRMRSNEVARGCCIHWEDTVVAAAFVFAQDERRVFWSHARDSVE